MRITCNKFCSISSPFSWQISCPKMAGFRQSSAKNLHAEVLHLPVPRGAPTMHAMCTTTTTFSDRAGWHPRDARAQNLVLPHDASAEQASPRTADLSYAPQMVVRTHASSLWHVHVKQWNGEWLASDPFPVIPQTLEKGQVTIKEDPFTTTVKVQASPVRLLCARCQRY